MNSSNYSKSFNNDGFLLLKNVFSDKEISQSYKVTKELLSIDVNYNLFPKYYFNDRKDVGVLYDIYFRHKFYRDLIENDFLNEVFSQIFKDNFYLYESSLVYKPPGKRNEVPFHQDFMDRSNEPFKIIVWVALTDVTAENGALKIVPGSHKKGFKEYVKIEGEAHHTRLKGWESFDENSKIVEMKKGDVLFFHNMVIHGSDRTHSKKDRLAARYSVQNFDGRNVPRGIPIILSKDTDFSSLPESKVNMFRKDTIVTKILRKVRKYSESNFPI